MVGHCVGLTWSVVSKATRTSVFLLSNAKAGGVASAYAQVSRVWHDEVVLNDNRSCHPGGGRSMPSIAGLRLPSPLGGAHRAGCRALATAGIVSLGGRGSVCPAVGPQAAPSVRRPAL